MSCIVVRTDQPLPTLPAHAPVAGVDEAGRGPLAGPVVAAAVILPHGHDLPGLNDSKQLDEKRREALYDPIREQAVSWAIAEVQADEIDRLNILRATLKAMHQALAELTPAPAHVLVDGRHCPAWPGPAFAVIQGDARVEAISAASILAKVYRDRRLRELDACHPQYGFARHKGYPTAEHLEALRRHGPCPAHRRSYRPVREVLEAGS